VYDAGIIYIGNPRISKLKLIKLKTLAKMLSTGYTFLNFLIQQCIENRVVIENSTFKLGFF
jgi:hypothetical protein